jgi:hypothetical protein
MGMPYELSSLYVCEHQPEMKTEQKNRDVSTKSFLPTLPKTAVLYLEVELLEKITHMASEKMENALCEVAIMSGKFMLCQI